MYHHTRISCNTCRRNKRSIVNKNQIPHFKFLIIITFTTNYSNISSWPPGIDLKLSYWVQVKEFDLHSYSKIFENFTANVKILVWSSNDSVPFRFSIDSHGSTPFTQR
ncbi:unnamed protein product [Coffea canephora]|uniref:Uncharacterized protein n=1 Tax=Coffea canephora TaxID=49390 RepID=A0A068TNM9_COFCA|nr:unnamed protein product [Coffea canephora]